MQIITYILTVCAAAVLGVNMQGEAKSHKSQEHKERREEKRARKHERKHHKDQIVAPEKVIIPEVVVEVTAPACPDPVNTPVGKGHSPQP